MMDETLIAVLRALIGAFAGTVGFAMLIHVPRKSWLPCGIIAGMAYLVYWALVRIGCPDPLSVFVGSLYGSLTGQICARKMKMISTVFLFAAIIPVVPGLGLYRMMAFLGQEKITAGVELGIQAMITIAMIALGISMGSFVDRLVYRRKTD